MRVVPDRTIERGFTLVELMIVVTIVGVLATIGVYSIRQYVRSSKTTEAMATIQAIRGAQEGWHATTGSYLDVSETMTSWFPSAPGRHPRGFWTGADPELSKWRLLNPPATGNVLFGYVTKAGGAGTAMPAFPTAAQPSGTPDRRWYVIAAKADADEDGTASHLVATSLQDAILSENPGE